MVRGGRRHGFNGKFMPENQLLIPFRDRSWRYGGGAFDMTCTFNGRAFRLKEHIDRFYCSLRYLRLDPTARLPPAHGEVPEYGPVQIHYLFRKNWRANAAVD
jgi:hypothetical protein